MSIVGVHTEKQKVVSEGRSTSPEAVAAGTLAILSLPQASACDLLAFLGGPSHEAEEAYQVSAQDPDCKDKRHI